MGRQQHQFGPPACCLQPLLWQLGLLWPFRTLQLLWRFLRLSSAACLSSIIGLVNGESGDPLLLARSVGSPLCTTSSLFANAAFEFFITGQCAGVCFFITVTTSNIRNRPNTVCYTLRPDNARIKNATNQARTSGQTGWFKIGFGVPRIASSR